MAFLAFISAQTDLSLAYHGQHALSRHLGHCRDTAGCGYHV